MLSDVWWSASLKVWLCPWGIVSSALHDTRRPNPFVDKHQWVSKWEDRLMRLSIYPQNWWRKEQAEKINWLVNSKRGERLLTGNVSSETQLFKVTLASSFPHAWNNSTMRRTDSSQTSLLFFWKEEVKIEDIIRAVVIFFFSNLVERRSDYLALFLPFFTVRSKNIRAEIDERFVCL